LFFSKRKNIAEFIFFLVNTKFLIMHFITKISDIIDPVIVNYLVINMLYIIFLTYPHKINIQSILIFHLLLLFILRINNNKSFQ